MTNIYVFVLFLNLFFFCTTLNPHPQLTPAATRHPPTPSSAADTSHCYHPLLPPINHHLRPPPTTHHQLSCDTILGALVVLIGLVNSEA
ncbi:hypothetical protein GBA52_010516 [Prunus armeniaca]|nr:hypothetical protein GBA52_010516 [Prunus armeniaca]